jgi:hypothetical protein
MASRWFVFWIACWVVAALTPQYEYLSPVFLILAALTNEPKVKRED